MSSPSGPPVNPYPKPQPQPAAVPQEPIDPMDPNNEDQAPEEEGE